MMQKPVPVLVLSLICGVLVLVACGGIGSKPNSESISSNSSSKPSDEALKRSPKDSISYQFDLLKQGDAERLKECFTSRIRDRITSEAVEKGKAQASNYTLEDLVDSVEMGEAEGQKTAKIMMKNGRTLTTLIETDGKWLADTVWFR